MNVYELFESMDGIDDSVLERSERSQRSMKRFAKPALIAACCALVLTLLYVHVKANIAYPPPVSMETTVPQETTEDLRQVVSEPYYNEGGEVCYRALERIYHTMHRLTQEEITPLLPPKTANWMSFTAEAMVLEDARTYRLFLHTPSRIAGANILIVLGQYDQPFYHVSSKDALIYLCGKTKYILGLADGGLDESVLFACATVNGVPVYLEMHVSSAELERAKADFEEMLICVDSFSEAAPDLSKVSPSQEAYAWYKPCSLEDVKEDPNLAMLLPEEKFLEFSKAEVIWERTPYGGIDRVSITGYRFGMYKALEWDIFCCWDADETVDMYRMIYYGSSEPVDAIDLTLETIKEFVAENRYTSAKGTVYYNTYNIRFSDHVMVSITIEEVSPRWLYEQLIAVRDRLQQAG